MFGAVSSSLSVLSTLLQSMHSLSIQLFQSGKASSPTFNSTDVYSTVMVLYVRVCTTSWQYMLM